MPRVNPFSTFYLQVLRLPVHLCLTRECGAQAGTRVGAPGARKGRP